MSEWKPVVGFEDYYEISESGALRRKPREIWNGKGIVELKQKELVGAINPKGYQMYILCVSRKQTSRLAHHLVLEAFVGPRESGEQARHLDNNKLNNHFSNLKWGTSSENNYDRVMHGVHAQARKTHCLRGHPFEGDNLHITRIGKRVCLTCRKLLSRRAEERRRMRRAESGLRKSAKDE